MRTAYSEQLAEESQRRRESGYKWDRRFLRLADHVATWSKDPSTQVGAVIVRPDRTIASIGFNGFPRGMDDSPELLADREVKYSRTVHAEMNAILNAPAPVKGCTLYLAMLPCDRCAVHVIQAGIVRVVAWEMTEDMNSRWADSMGRTRDMLREAGVHFLEIKK